MPQQPKLGAPIGEAKVQPRLGQPLGEATGLLEQAPLTLPKTEQTQVPAQTPEQTQLGTLDFLAESARIGVKNMSHTLSRALYQVRPFFGAGDPIGNVTAAGNVAARIASPDFARKQDDEVTAILQKYDAIERRVLGEDAEAPLLPPMESAADLLSLKRIANVALEQGPTLAAQLAVTLAHPVLGSALMLATEGGGAREEVLQAEAKGSKPAGFDREFLPNIAGTFNMALELAGIGPLVKLTKAAPLLKSKLFTVVLGMITEPLTEAVQEFNTASTGKVAELGSTDAYYQELKANGIDDDTIRRVKDAFFAAMVLSGVAGGTTVTLQHVAEKGQQQYFPAIVELVDQAVSSAQERNRRVPTTVSNDVKRVMQQEAAELDANEPTNIDEYDAAVQSGQLPVFVGLPKLVADHVNLTGQSITSEDALFNAVYRFNGIDPNTLPTELRSYIETDAHERLRETRSLGITFSTKNMATKWGGVVKSVVEEMSRRIAVADQAKATPERLEEIDNAIQPKNLGEVTVSQSNFTLQDNDVASLTKLLGSVRDGIARGTLPPEFGARVIYDTIANVQQGKPAVTPIVPLNREPNYDRTNAQVISDIQQDYYEAAQNGDQARMDQVAQTLETYIEATKDEEEYGIPDSELSPIDDEGDQVLLEEIRQRDLRLPHIHRGMTPVFALRNFPEAQAMSQALVDAELRTNKKTYTHYAFFDKLIALLGKKNRGYLRTDMQTLYDGNASAISELRDLHPERYQAATQMIEWFKNRRADIKEYKRLMLRLTMTEDMMSAFDSVVTGKRDIASAATAYQVERARLLDIVSDYVSVDSWGIDDYITNAMVGSWKAVDDNGSVRVVATTKTELARRVAEFFRENPQVRTLTIDTNGPQIEQGTPLGKRAYFAMVGKIGAALESGAEDISRSVARELAKTALRGAVSIKPSKKWSPFLVQRKGVLKGETDLFDVLYSYAHSVEKKMHIDPPIYLISQKIDTLPPRVKEVLMQQIEDLKGRYYDADQFVDAIARWVGDTNIGAALHIGTGRPFRASAAASVITKGTAIAKLGYRVIGMIVNKLGGEHHVWTKVGTKYAIRAKKWLRTEEGKAFIAEEEAIGELGNTFAGQGPEALPWWHALYLFNKPEAGLRRYGLAANYLLARDTGLGEEQAKYSARKAMQFQLFLYNTAAIPRLLRGPTGRVAGQFRAYLIQEMQFVSQLSPREFLRYSTGMFLLGGIRGAIAFATSLPIIGAFIGFDRLEEWLNREWPRLSRGLAGLFNGDTTAAGSWQLPNTMEDMAGAFIGEIYRLIKNVITPALEGGQHVSEDLKEWAGNIVTVQKSLKGLFDAVVSADGWVRDSKGNPVYRPEAPWDLFLLALGVTPLSKSQQDVAERIYLREVAVNRKNYVKEMDILTRRVQYGEALQSVVTRMQNYIDAGGTLPLPIVNALTAYADETGQISPEQIDKLIVFGMSDAQAIQSRVKKSYMPPDQRRLYEARLLEKLKALEAFDLQYDR